MKIVVDFDRCESNAVCMGIAPEIFEVRDDNFLYILDENPPESKRAADYLIERLRDQTRPVRILALGPMTNLAEALKRQPSIARAIEELVIMGGAVRVPGNLGDGAVFKHHGACGLAAKILYGASQSLRCFRRHQVH